MASFIYLHKLFTIKMCSGEFKEFIFLFYSLLKRFFLILLFILPFYNSNVIYLFFYNYLT